MVGRRKGRAGGSKCWLSQEAVSMATGGRSQLTGGRSSQQGLPRPACWGTPGSFGPGARSFRSGRKGLTAVPLEFHLRSKVSHSAALVPARSRSCPRVLTHSYPTPGLHSHARLRRDPRTQRTPSCLTSRTTHAPPQCGVESSQRRVADSDSSAHVDPSTESAVWCDFDTPVHTQDHKQF